MWSDGNSALGSATSFRNWPTPTPAENMYFECFRSHKVLLFIATLDQRSARRGRIETQRWAARHPSATGQHLHTTFIRVYSSVPNTYTFHRHSRSTISETWSDGNSALGSATSFRNSSSEGSGAVASMRSEAGEKASQSRALA